MKYEASCRTPRTSKVSAEPMEKSLANGAREAIEVGLHQGALLMLEELDVAVPNEIIGPPASLRGRRPVLHDTASLIDRLEAGEDGGVVGLSSQESA